jgi:hypothetical protein
MHWGHRQGQFFHLLYTGPYFWVLADEARGESQPLTAFTIPGRGQFHWITSPMGLLGRPASFQRLMEQVLRGLQNVLIYIDNVLIHTDTHEWHVKALEQVMLRLHKNHLKIDLNKCLFGDQQVSYLGLTLTPQGIKPGEAKLRMIKLSKAPTDVKSIRSCVGLCIFFRNHIQNFTITAAPLFKLTRQDLGYPLRTFTKGRKEGISGPPDAIRPRPDIGFSPSWPRISTDHQLIYTHHGHSRRTMRNLGTKGWKRTEPNHFASFQATKRKWEKLLTLSTQDSGRCLGHGKLQWISERVPVLIRLQHRIWEQRKQKPGVDWKLP